VQALYFVLLARALGVTSYGAFTAAVAVAALAAPFSALGTNILMVKNVARSQEMASAHFFRAVFYTVAGGIALTFVLAIVGPHIVPPDVSPWALAAIAFADLIGLKLIELAGYMWQAVGRSKPLAILPTLMNLLRLSAVVLVGLIGVEVTVNAWAFAYLLATLPLGVKETLLLISRSVLTN
jgi:O-antigen/teichoic acid export membrane protein